MGPYFGDVFTPTFDSKVVEKVETINGLYDATPFIMFRLDNLTIGGMESDSVVIEASVDSR